MGQFVKECFKGQLRKWVNCDTATTAKPLHISVCVIERDALNVQRELANVRSEIEQIEGRKRFLESQASLSTIRITLRTPTAISGSSKGFFYRLTEALSAGFDGALSFILFFVTAAIALLPFLILVVLPIWLILRYLWRKYSWKRRVRPHNTVEIVEAEIKDE